MVTNTGSDRVVIRGSRGASYPRHPPVPGAARVFPQAVPKQAPLTGVPYCLVPAWDGTAAAPGAAAWDGGSSGLLNGSNYFVEQLI